MKFGEKIRTARLAAGYTQRELAEKTGISLRTIQNYENEGRLPKQREYYDYLAKALNIDVNNLLDDTSDFILKAAEEYGSRGQKQAIELTEKVTGLYAGGELDDDDMDAMMKAIQDAYWDAKRRNKKYIPKKYRKNKEDSQGA